MGATVIDKTELVIIKARKKPNAIAARALIRAGTGHKYWSEFPEDTKGSIEAVARSVYELIHHPEIQSPIRTLELPVAGSAYTATAVNLIFELINFANGLVPAMWEEEPKKSAESQQGKSRRRRRKRVGAEPLQKIQDDENGIVTLAYLTKVKKIVSRITGDSSDSLGLHPAVYFWGPNGRFQPTAFLATVALIQQLDQNDSFDKFTDARRRLEDILLAHKLASRIVHKFGGFPRGLDAILKAYNVIINGVLEQKTDDEIIRDLVSERQLKFLAKSIEEDREVGKDFSTEVRGEAFRNAALPGVVRCAECGGALNAIKSMSLDHKTPIREGGVGDLTNAAIMHPYCNTGRKEKRMAQERKDKAAL